MKKFGIILSEKAFGQRFPLKICATSGENQPKTPKSRDAWCVRRSPNGAGDTRTLTETADQDLFFRDPLDGGCTFVVPTRPVNDSSRGSNASLPIFLGHIDTMNHWALLAQHSKASHMLPAPPQQRCPSSICCTRTHDGSHHHHIMRSGYLG